MNQPSANLKTRRKSSIGGSLAIVVAAVALALGASGVAQAADVHGTIVAAERYRAPQPSTQDIELGDDAVAQLLQNDAFLKVIKDSDVQRLVVEPGFGATSRLLLDHAEAARQVLAGRVAAQSDEAMRVLGLHASAARMLLDHPEATRAMYRHPEATQRFVSAQIRAEADHRTVADRQSDDMTADRFKANPRKNSQAEDMSADRFKANPRKNSQADDVMADRHSSVDGESTDDKHKG